MDDTGTDQPNALAEKRTETAFHRTLLAEQRTYSAWVRTGLASSATGFAVAQLMTEAEPDWLVRCLAILFIVAGACMFLLAFWAYRNALTKSRDLPAGGVPQWMLAALSFTLFIAATIGLYLIT